MYVLYQKMLLRSARFEGRIMYRSVYADMEEQLAKDFDETRDMMQMVLSYFVSMGIVVKYDRYIYFPEAARLLGSECDSAERVRRHRYKVTHNRYDVTNDANERYKVTGDKANVLQSNGNKKNSRYNVTNKMLQSNGEGSSESVSPPKGKGTEAFEKVRSYADREDE